MAKNLSQNRIRSTEALASRSDLTSLNTLSQTISKNLLTAMTVIDAEDFPKIQNIQNNIRNKENDVQNLIIQQVDNYNQQLQNYNNFTAELGAYPTPPPPASNGFAHYSSLITAKKTARNAMTTIAPFSTTALDISAVTHKSVTSGSLHSLLNTQNSLRLKNTYWETITTEGARFNITGPIAPIEGTGRTIGGDFFNFGQQPAGNITYGLYNPDSSVATVGNITIAGTDTPCYLIHFDNNGTKTEGYIPKTQIAIDTASGQLRVGETTTPHNLVVYDATGRVVTPSNDFTLELHAGVSYNMEKAHSVGPDFAELELVHTKPLTIKRSVSSFDKSSVLNNPAFTRELNSRMGIVHRQHILAIDNKDSQIYQSIREHLEKYPDYVALSDTQKDELYHRVLGLTQVDTADYSTTPPTHITRDLFGGAALSASINATQAWNTSAGAMLNHANLFADYVQDTKVVEPKPSAEDMKDQVSYRNWLTRNLTALTQNYIAHRFSSYLADNHVTQAINDTITGYTTNYEQTKLDGTANLLPNMQDAARRLRQAKPNKLGTSQANTTWMRLMADKSADIKDTITHEDGTTVDYTSVVRFNPGKGVSATFALGDNKPVTVYANTPGELMASVLSGVGGRSINNQRDRMMVAFGTMKAIIKTYRDNGVHLTVPINGTTNDELRISLDNNDMLKVERHNYNHDSDEFERDEILRPGTSVPRWSFDESNPDHKNTFTHEFLVSMNDATNTIMNRQYKSFHDTVSNATSNVRNLGRWMSLDRERMSYKANPRWLRGIVTKFLNRKEGVVEPFNFPIQAGDKTGTASYDPDGTITIDIDGKTRKGKNLAKLLNPFRISFMGGFFNRGKKNITDGFEMSIMQGLYEGLSGQLIKNDRVNRYTYLVRDPQNQQMYAMYQGPDGSAQIGIIENVSRNTGPVSRVQDMLLFDHQKWGRTTGIPPQGIRELEGLERQAILSRPEIMDGFMQNMLKAREEMINIPFDKYRSISLNANSLGRVATVAGAVAVTGGINLATHGWFANAAHTAGLETTKFMTGTAPHTLGGIVKSTAHGLGQALGEGAKVIGMGVQGTAEGLKLVA